MIEINDFEEQWMVKLKTGMVGLSKQQVYEKIVAQNSQSTNLSRIIELVKIITSECSEKEVNEILTVCACTASKEMFIEIREYYSKNKDLENTHKLLQETFRDFIRKYKNLTDEQINMILEKGMGMAGVLHDEIVTATKIPKQFHEYYNEQDPHKKKYYYCHCPMIRGGFLTEEEMPNSDFCLCGAGFYKDLWEYILGRKVKVSLKESLLKGDGMCKIVIDLKEQ